MYDMHGSISAGFGQKLCSVIETQGKQIKAVEVKGKTILALYNVNGSIYCSDANSTAYQFPLTNGKILQSKCFFLIAKGSRKQLIDEA